MFGLLGLPSRFAIDRGELEQRYLELSKQVHPDRFINADAGERVAALQKSMQLNDAYKTLRKPAPRAEYLLAREGVTIGANEQLDPTFLLEILELREELAEAKRRGDRVLLGRLEEQMEDREYEALERLGAGFGELEAGRGERAEVLASLKRELILLRYIRRYLEEFEVDIEGEL